MITGPGGLPNVPLAPRAPTRDLASSTLGMITGLADLPNVPLAPRAPTRDLASSTLRMITGLADPPTVPLAPPRRAHRGRASATRSACGPGQGATAS
ncbi:hypothetical protein Acsp06_07310 [Actinomycetospora sp. NBRC 106375]|uniref:hypothetical protein n=1 Tax=Actinomycetospora sp. NBRC 106375 TaxID=3032207 RepID=UPI0024A47583|nr:hypothetical protein [Actinomycetospora sp. NBRC 106375]GLZ44546.1 hypothetical protein Acsp06_07310 [Actinomycetospora sp. NBRC 106375]